MRLLTHATLVAVAGGAVIICGLTLVAVAGGAVIICGFDLAQPRPDECHPLASSRWCASRPAPTRPCRLQLTALAPYSASLPLRPPSLPFKFRLVSLGRRVCASQCRRGHDKGGSVAGGQLLLIVVEAARGRPLNANLTRSVNGTHSAMLAHAFNKAGTRP